MYLCMAPLSRFYHPETRRFINAFYYYYYYCSASGLFAECGIPNCKAVIRSLIYKFITRLNESTNDVILAILSSDIRDFSYKALLGKDIVCAP